MKNILIMSVLIFGSCIMSGQDTIAPTISGISINPHIVNTSDSTQRVYIDLKLEDNLSGLPSSISLNIVFPNGVTIYPVTSLTSGTNLDGNWSTVVFVPAGMSGGQAVVNLTLQDNVGNTKSFTYVELKNLGFDADFEIINNNQDTLAPTLLELDISPQIVDVNATPQIVYISIKLKDDLSGIPATINPVIIFPNGTTIYPGAYFTSGNMREGIWSSTITVPVGMPEGIAHFNLNFQDYAGNSLSYTSEDLVNLGFDADFEIVNSFPDTLPPNLIAMTISPQIVNISDSLQDVFISFDLEDNLSGLPPNVNPFIQFPNGLITYPVTQFISGTTQKGQWRAIVFVPFGMQEGKVNINLNIVDKVGNSQTYTFADLKNLNFDSDFEIVNSLFRVKGTAIFDQEMDGCDLEDINKPNLKFSITNGVYSGTYIAGSNGNYLIPILEGENFIVPLIENPDYFEVFPNQFSINMPSTSDTILQDFCISPKGTLRKVDLSIVPLSPPAIPGFNTQYKIVMTNNGNIEENGTLNFYYEKAKMKYVSGDVPPTSQNDGFLSWDYMDLLPFETRYFNVTFDINTPTDSTAVISGDELTFSCSILDNIFTLKQTVVGSFDPNDKTCLEGNTITPNQIGEYVHYLIRFENTGNWAAEDIVVKDIIDESTFDISTLQITDASHEAWSRIKGNEVEFIFDNIQLPFEDGYNDGYVVFKIKTRPTLDIGHELQNEANIYFDYNLPILTNRTNTVVTIPDATNNVLKENVVDVFPNPVSDVIRFLSTEQIIKVEIFDISGRVVQISSVRNNEVNVETLKSGTYFLKLLKKEGTVNCKVVKL